MPSSRGWASGISGWIQLNPYFSSGNCLNNGDPIPAAPYGTGPDDLFVAYYASAELGCHLAIGWPLPDRILDLCAEFHWLTSGLPVPFGRGLFSGAAAAATFADAHRDTRRVAQHLAKRRRVLLLVDLLWNDRDGSRTLWIGAGLDRRE